MRTAYLHCQSGVSGDMLLAALADAGAAADGIEKELAKLPLPDWKMEFRRERKAGFACARVVFSCPREREHRRLAEILAIVDSGGLSPFVTEKAAAVFRCLAKAEAAAHGIAEGEVHFHEVGAVDSILDVCGVLIALEQLGIDAIAASPLPLAQGESEGCHGTMPLPAPALQSLLLGVPVFGRPSGRELVTPTGLALLKGLGCRFGEFPSFCVAAVGCGGGSAELPWPNLLRVFIGDREEGGGDTVVRLEAVLDDMSGEHFGYLWEEAFRLGALDMYYVPIQMKKGRPGIQINLLAPPEKAASLGDFLLRETSTLGLIERPETRRILNRSTTTVRIAGGDVRVKHAGGAKAAPEYEDVSAIAGRERRPFVAVYQEALAAFRKIENGK